MAPQLTTLGLGGDKMAEKIEITALHSFYRSLSELVGTEAMLEVYGTIGEFRSVSRYTSMTVI